MACVTLKRSLEFDPIHPSGSCSQRPSKRRRCIPMCVSPQSAAAVSACNSQSQSPFLDSSPTLTPELIATNVRNEILRLKRRKQLQLGDKTMDCEGGYESPTSPQSSSSPGRCSPVISLSSQSPSNKEKALFTFKQVNLICEQLVREREVKIREEYDKVLSAKLAEQYDCFVRFTLDQIHQRLSPKSLPSYLS
ncbi:UNVERIFIED_CONTAM: hypothetical protein RMT77_015690 [Armadillidium vulgare]|nr:Akirin [Armadillidium vulgare]RXG55696.1 Akirin [Armadillidium vulgare]RXG57794.1 Akirin [Armadillidium vulgare]